MALRAPYCPDHVSKIHGCHTLIRQIEVSTRIFGKHSRLFEKPSKSSTAKEQCVTLKLEKDLFLVWKIDYLQHVIRPGRLEIAKTTAINKELMDPATQSVVWSFLGLRNVSRRFVPNSSHVAVPLKQKHRKAQPIPFQTLMEPERYAVQQLNSLLTNPPVLTLPRADDCLTINSDTCDIQLGCVFLQKQNYGTMRLIAYWSRTLAEPKKKLATAD